MSVWTWLWIAWGVAFALIEGTAIALGDWKGTLSDHLRAWFSTKTKPGRTAWVVVSGVFFAWFVVHVAVGGSL